MKTGQTASILVISISDLNRDSRVRRQIQTLLSQYEVHTLSLSGPDDLPVTRHHISRVFHGLRGKLSKHIVNTVFLKRYDKTYWADLDCHGVFRELSNIRFAAVIANDVDALPIARAIASTPSAIVLDAHEYAPEQNGHQFKWRIFKRPVQDWICRDLSPGLGGYITVGPRIAKEYLKRYHFEPDVMFNTPGYADLRPSEVEPTGLRAIHHGMASRNRRLEEMILAMDHVTIPVTLDLMLVSTGDSTYFSRISRLADLRKNVRLIPARPAGELVEFANQYDIGLYSLPPKNFNQLYALPNKLFEFIQSRLCVAVGPSPEMARIVRKTGTGVVAKSFKAKDIGRMLDSLTVDQVLNHKERSHAVAAKYCYEAQEPILLSVVEKAIALGRA